MRALGFWIVVSSLVVVGGCSCGSDENNTGPATDGSVSNSDATNQSGNLDGSVAGDGSSADGRTTSDGGPAPTCSPVGGACTTPADCCGGRACESLGGAELRCIDETTCTGIGNSCTRASDCCSLACNGTNCVDPSGGGGGLCTPSGSDPTDNGCTGDSECCSDNCTDDLCEAVPSDSGGACNTLGELCNDDGECCSNLCQDLGSAGKRCARSSWCNARGEICSAADDCCSGVCDDDGRCPTQNEIGGTGFAGEPCDEDTDCSTRACAPDFPDGPKLCQPLGGCRPAGDGASTGSLCTQDWECCGFAELSAGSDMCLDGKDLAPDTGCVDQGFPGIKICELQTTDKEVGEICKFADDTNDDGMIDPATELVDFHNCCCASGVDCCVPSSSGVYRCRGGIYDPGDPTACFADGEDCQVADECCTGICVPKPGGGGFVCGACVTDGNACTRHADCCGFSCIQGQCQGGVPPTPDGGVPQDAGPPPVCLPLGASCTDNNDCCSTYCQNGSCSTFVILL